MAVVLVLSRLLLSPISVSSINNWFSDRGLESEIEDLSFDIYNGEVSLVGLLARKGEIPVFRLDEFRLGWSWSALFERQLMLESMLVSGLEFEVERKADGGFVLAAIDLAELSQGDPQQPAEASTSEAPRWSVALQRLEIENLKGCYRQPPKIDYCNALGVLEWNGSLEFDLSRLNETGLPLVANGDIRLANLSLRNNRLQRRMLGFDEFAITGLGIRDLELIEIEAASLQKLALLENAEDSEVAEITRFEKLELEKLRLDQLKRVEIANVRILNQQGRLTKRDDDQLDINEWLQDFDNDSESADEKSAAGEKAFTYAIDKLVYETEHSLQYVDLSLSNTFVIDLNNILLVIENLDSADTAQSSRIEYQATYAKHGKLNLAGTGTPLDPTPTLDLAGNIEGLDLPEFSAFTANAIGHRIKSGQLDAALELKATDSVLNSKVDLRLDHLKLVEVSEKDREKIDNKLGFPLNTSLSLLKDRNEVIELSIPITGDFNSPEFDPTDAISKAASSAITAAVLNYYTPFGLVTLTEGLFSLATALRFDPVAFEPGNGDIEKGDHGGLDKIADLMRQRPGVSVTLCAYTNSEDRNLLLPNTAEIAADELELDEEQIAVLEKLGEARRDQVEDYLVSKKIDPARLISCDTEHREGTGLAGVEISI